ncbi:MAG TPA: AraC family transcriptional regulator [Candidatus Odoribacter faecigallinarum]|uniref:AraC family transcriptional regulator n=1 Tax=Candidatus Odoribacter faecigallinarum TaxID=2838706 RepID=A0A9D1UZ17_9BACT|nr:AraC family transcriptional regulator [Candidatus Odoribacter faecigallinarum]
MSKPLTPVVCLLNPKEHRTCTNFKADIGTGFHHELLHSGESIMLKPEQSHHLLFFMQGECILDCNQFTGRKFQAGETILIPQGAKFKGLALTKVEIMDMAFETIISSCDKLELQGNNALPAGFQYKFQALPIRDPLWKMLQLLAQCLEAGMGCVHLHELKHRETFLYFRTFYTKKEIAKLFFPLSRKFLDFKDLVYHYLKTGASVEQLADLAGMSKTTFQRKFKEAFGESAGTWLRRKLCDRIVQELTLPDVCIKDVVYKFNFASHASFTRFCKANFQETPMELRARIQKSKG